MTRNYQEIVEQMLYGPEGLKQLSVYSYDEVKKMVDIAYELALDENDIIHGDRAKEFIDEVFNPKPLSEKQKKFLDDCTASYRNKPIGKTNEK